MDGSNTIERAYTASELHAIMEQMRAALPPKASVSVVMNATYYSRPRNRVTFLVAIDGITSNLAIDGNTFEDAIAKLHDAVVAMPKPDDAWAIIGAVAA